MPKPRLWEVQERGPAVKWWVHAKAKDLSFSHHTMLSPKDWKSFWEGRDLHIGEIAPEVTGEEEPCVCVVWRKVIPLFLYSQGDSKGPEVGQPSKPTPGITLAYPTAA